MSAHCEIQAARHESSHIETCRKTCRKRAEGKGVSLCDKEWAQSADPLSYSTAVPVTYTTYLAPKTSCKQVGIDKVTK